ncbi:hypothetical protein OAP63_00345 [Vibrio sp.]|nr:hypothetical protein [Vibrio sp.]
MLASSPTVIASLLHFGVPLISASLDARPFARAPGSLLLLRASRTWTLDGARVSLTSFLSFRLLHNCG